MTQADNNKSLVRAAFQYWERGDPTRFFDLIADDVNWTVIGTTRVSGVYSSKQALIDTAFGPLLEQMEGPLTTRLRDVSADGTKVFLEFASQGVTHSGVHYDQVYCWSMTMQGEKIDRIIAYLDTDLLRRVLG